MCANEFKHTAVGTSVSDTEWAAAGTHYALSQTQGDILAFNGTNWVRVAERFNVEMFDADPTGADNSATEIQAAITAAAS